MIKTHDCIIFKADMVLLAPYHYSYYCQRALDNYYQALRYLQIKHLLEAR